MVSGSRPRESWNWNCCERVGASCLRIDGVQRVSSSYGSREEVAIKTIRASLHDEGKDLMESEKRKSEKCNCRVTQSKAVDVVAKTIVWICAAMVGVVGVVVQHMAGAESWGEWG